MTAMSEQFLTSAPISDLWDRHALQSLQADLHRSTKDFVHLLEEEEKHPAFDPLHVRNLLRDERAKGHEPTLLILGRMEMASFHHFICRGYGEECGAEVRDLYFLGIAVVSDPSPSRLEFTDEESHSSDDPHGSRAA